MKNRLAVWAAEQKSGFLEAQEQRHNYVFAYSHPELAAQAQVSLTMPVRLESWTSRNLHPIFQMNLPEGALLEAIRRVIAKLAGNDDLAILRVTGGNQVGRNRFSLADDSSPVVIENHESLNELLTYPDAVELFQELLAKYAIRSGISGVQPKVMLDACERTTAAMGGYIAKSWSHEFPQLGANEFFCMTAARLAGLPVPEFHLSANGGLFLIKRFDIADDGMSLGFEDMCSLQAVGTAGKYGGAYERVARSIRDFVSPDNLFAAREQFFATLALNCMLRNGDAHLKNFGVLYDFPGASVRLAPVYDIVTTTAYITKDVPALSLSGTKKWWPRKIMEAFAVSHLTLPIGKITEIFDRTAEAVHRTVPLVRQYMADHPEFREIGDRMLKSWQTGVDELMKRGN